MTFDGKVLMITGGTGSFGNAVLKRFLNSGVREIRIFSRDEKKQDDLRNKLKNPLLKFHIGDVRDYVSIANALVGVDYVFHAAALKQVPSCEFHPMEAFKTNVVGTENVIRAAASAKVKKLILLSTDKAVYPINAMGISKAMAEKVLLAAARQQAPDGTVFCATRYGNVMASRGSVIPLFVSQIIQSGPITITDANMTRFLMSLEDSVDLVMQAFNEGQQGDIFVQKAPAATVGVVAEALKTIFNSTAQTQIIGTRHGEKLFETLVSREEMAIAEEFGKYYRIPCDNRDLNYDKYFIEGQVALSETSDYTSHNAERLDLEQTVTLLRTLDYIRERNA